MSVKSQACGKLSWTYREMHILCQVDVRGDIIVESRTNASPVLPQATLSVLKTLDSLDVVLLLGRGQVTPDIVTR
jgi:hypothetical protein